MAPTVPGIDAEAMRSMLARRAAAPAGFRAALEGVSACERDAWVDRVLGLGEIPDDGPGLPRGGVPYLPCPVEVLLRAVDLAEIRAEDVFVDLGAGVGRAAALVHFLTGASAIGVEIQPGLVASARALANGPLAPRLAVIEGDASHLPQPFAAGTVFFLYCPFGGARLTRVLHALEAIAATRPIRVCCVDLPLPACPWLSAMATSPSGELVVYRGSPTGHRARSALERYR